MSTAMNFDVKEITGNPAPLGLSAFGLTTILLNIHNAGFYEFNTMILSMGLFYGGLAQLFVGIMEWKKNNTFGLTAFTSYGCFWLSLVGLLVMPKFGWGQAPSEFAMVNYFVLWGFFSFLLFIGTLRISRALQFVFGSLTILFFMLAIGDATGNILIKQATGFEGIFCGLTAIYAAIAQVLNDVYGSTVLPLGNIPKKAAPSLQPSTEAH